MFEGFGGIDVSRSGRTSSGSPFEGPADVRPDLVKHEPTSFPLEWTLFTRMIVCTTPIVRSTTTVVECFATLLEDDRMIFGIPALPTDFELEFTIDCDDVDANDFLGDIRRNCRSITLLNVD